MQEKKIDTGKIGAIIRKNLIVLTRDRVRLMPLIMFPFLMILIFGYTTGNIPKHVPAVIVSYGNSPVAQQLIDRISASDVFTVRYMASTEGEARKLLDAGKVRAVVVIPAGIDDDISAGRQAGITVIVDESDSAVAQTAKETLKAIVGGISDSLSMQKVTAYQRSVKAAAGSILAYNSMQRDSYSRIINILDPAASALAQAGRINRQYASSISSSMGETSIFVPPNTDRNYSISSNETFVRYPLGYGAAKSQLAIVQQTGSLMGAAAGSIDSARAVAQASSSAEEQRSSYQNYNKNVEEPAAAISAFTQSDPTGMLNPLLYQEKPAYGTGKRPIDFAIAAIIALTIFQGAVMGMGRAIAGEKREGSLTRVFLTPTSNETIIIGTLSFYILFELVRSSFIILVAVAIFHIAIEGNLLAIGFILALFAAVSTSIGLIISSLVKTEQQFMAMAMLVTLPTIFLSGAFFPLQAMPRFLQAISGFLPVTYAAEALRGVMIKGFPLANIILPIIILCIFLAISLSLVMMLFKRDIE